MESRETDWKTRPFKGGIVMDSKGVVNRLMEPKTDILLSHGILL